MDKLISIELSIEEWNKVLYGMHCACFLETQMDTDDSMIKEYRNIHDSIYNQLSFDYYEQAKKESH